MRRIALAVAAVVALLLLAVGAVFILRGSDTSLRTIRVGYMKLADCAPLFDREPFEKRGIKLELHEAPGGSVIIDSLIAGHLDIGFSNVVSPLLAREAGYDLVGVGGCTFEDTNNSRHGLVVMAGGPVRAVSDLRGRTVAVNTLRNIDHLLLLRWLRLNGLASSDINLVEVPFPRMDTVLESGQVAAVAIVEPFLTKTKQAGRRVLADYYSAQPTDHIDVTTYCAKRDWVFNNAPLAKDFRDALSEAASKLSNDRALLVDTVVEMTKLDKATVEASQLPAFSPAPTKAGLDLIAEELMNNGFTKRQVDGPSLLPPS